MPTGSVAPPQNLDAERRVLGSLLVFYTPKLTERVEATGLKPADFYYQRHEVVYRAILALTGREEHVDTLTVSGFLTRQQHAREGTWLNVAGGVAYVEYLASFADANGVVTLSRLLAEDGRWRRWLNAMYGAIDAAHARDEDGFWAAMSHVREDVLPGDPGLHVVDSGEKAA